MPVFGKEGDVPFKSALCVAPNKGGNLYFQYSKNDFQFLWSIVAILDSGTAWLDTGTCDSLSDASEFVRVIEKRQGTKIGCIEEIAYRMNYINKDDLQTLIKEKGKNDYSDYLKELYE